MPFVLVEGASRGGKSTLIERLAVRAMKDKWPIVVQHNGPYESWPDTIEIKLQFIERNYRDVYIIFDRWFISEYVYAPYQNRENTLGQMTFEEAIGTWWNRILDVGLPVWIRTVP